jgi:hypothetical protein
LTDVNNAFADPVNCLAPGIQASLIVAGSNFFAVLGPFVKRNKKECHSAHHSPLSSFSFRLSSSLSTMENRKLKSLPSRKGKGRQKDLPLENILDILKQSAWSTGTKNARNMCLICKAAYDECWPALHRIVALRSAASLQKYSRRLVEGGKRESSEQLRERQAALESLYINNTPKDAQTYPGSASCLTMILTVARNVRFCHFEEHWSNTSS